MHVRKIKQSHYRPG